VPAFQCSAKWALCIWSGSAELTASDGSVSAMPHGPATQAPLETGVVTGAASTGAAGMASASVDA